MKLMFKLNFLTLFSLGLFLLSGCAPMPSTPKPGPDKQSIGTFYGAAIGATSGAITGAAVGSSTGPGAWVGAGFGAVAGMFKGLGIDLVEEDQIRREEEERNLREIAWVHEVLNEHYARRLELHPNRDIFPADLFFAGDGVKLNDEGQVLARELAYLTKNRMPWSRIVIASYATSADSESSYASFLTERRAQAIATQFVQSGIEARRVLTQAATLSEPVLIDPYDTPGRYRQAIEIIALDH